MKGKGEEKEPRYRAEYENRKSLKQCMETSQNWIR